MATYDGADRGGGEERGILVSPIGVDREWIVVSMADTTPPVIDDAASPDESEIARNSTVTLRVTDETGLRRVAVFALFANGDWEGVTDGVSFAPRYAGSQRSGTPTDYTYLFRRAGGWPSDPLLRVLPVDTSGNESA
jgi:hypothetical protein